MTAVLVGITIWFAASLPVGIAVGKWISYCERNMK